MSSNRFTPEGITTLADLTFSFVLGLAFTQLIIGLDKLNPSFTSWLLVQGSDYSYHYLAWEYFRDTPWHWPLGRLEGFAYPMYNSIMYTDSIPVMALFFKCFRSFLSNDFQYFGIWFASCYILNTFFGIQILKHIGWSRFMRWLIAPFFTGATVLVVRFGHPALCAQWLILWALYIYLKRNDWNHQRINWQLGILTFLTSLIHPYLMFMILGVGASVLFQLKYEHKITTGNMLLKIACMLLLVLFDWYSCGAFLFKGKLSEGLGEFSANLNTFINAWDVGRLGMRFGYLGPGQGEGLGYLGLGILLLISLLSFYYFKNRFVHRKEIGDPARIKKKNWFFICSIIFFVFALSPKWTLGHYLLIDWHYNDYISRTFRGTGRFIWPLYYFILYWVFRRLYRCGFQPTILFVIVAASLAIQWMDLSPLWKRKPYIDEAGNHLPFINQLQYLFSISDKVIAYPPFHGTTADFGDYIYLADLAQRYHKPISTGYSARYPMEIGDTFKDSLADLSNYFNKNPHDILISSVDSLAFHKKLLKIVGGQSYQFERYRVFVPSALTPIIQAGIIDSINLHTIDHQQVYPLRNYLIDHVNDYIFGVIQQEGTVHLKEESRAHLRSLGGHIDSLKFGSSWAFVLYHNQFLVDQLSNSKPVRDSFFISCDRKVSMVKLYSGAFLANNENTSSISMNGIEYSFGKRGINILVTDSCGKVVDKVNADTYLSDLYIYR